MSTASRKVKQQKISAQNIGTKYALQNYQQKKNEKIYFSISFWNKNFLILIKKL